MDIRPKEMQVFEILDKLVEIGDLAEQIAYLRQHFGDHKPLRYVVKFNYCDSIKSLLPPGDAPFKKDELDGPSISHLWAYLTHFPKFMDSPEARQLPELRRESLFLEMLESLEIKEAEMIVLMKDKNLESRWPIPAHVFQAVFPDLRIIKMV